MSWIVRPPPGIPPQVRQAPHRHCMYSASKTSHRVALHLPHNPAGLSTLAGAFTDDSPYGLKNTFSCVENLPGSRNSSAIEYSTGFSAPNSCHGTSNLCLPRMNTMEDDVTRCPRGRAYKQKDPFFLANMPLVDWSIPRISCQPCGHPAWPGSSSYNTHLDKLVSGTDQEF